MSMLRFSFWGLASRPDKLKSGFAFNAHRLNKSLRVSTEEEEGRLEVGVSLSDVPGRHSIFVLRPLLAVLAAPSACTSGRW